jgi:transcriptional regulator with GAF, ATPase, and Fis domain
MIPEQDNMRTELEARPRPEGLQSGLSSCAWEGPENSEVNVPPQSQPISVAEQFLGKELEDRLQFEVLLTDLSARFVHIPADKVDGAIQDAQRRICEALGLDRSTLYQLRGPAREVVTTHCWARPEFKPNPLVSATKLYPWLSQQILAGQPIQFANVEEIPAEAVVDKESIRRLGPKSNVTFPLIAGGKHLGALAFGTLRTERVWSEPLVNRLRLIAEIIASALSRQAADEALRQALDEVRQLQDKLQQENAYLRQEVKDYLGHKRLTGQSPALQRVISQVEQVAPTGSTVLLQGETGTGKEVIASAIHDLSPRAGHAMVTVNCAAIPSTLIESELFGREKGAYTGALTRQAGRFEVAAGSTIFLDEISELPPDIQVKLLRVLQEKEIQRLGSQKPVKVDIRIIAATNRDLEKLVREGKFREDLYYRLNVFPIRVPPLRERREDIPPLVWAFVEEFAGQFGKHIEAIGQATMDQLQRYPWPGNVRELRNVVERAMIVSSGARLKIERPGADAARAPLGLAMEDVEREHILRVLEQCAWRVRGKHGAAAILELKPTTLEFRMAKLGLRRPA